MAEYEFVPLYDKLVIKPEETKNVTKGGIVIPEGAEERTQRGYVVAAGPGRLLNSGDYAGLAVGEGDYVIYAKYGGTEIKTDDGEVFILLSERDIHVVLEKYDE